MKDRHILEIVLGLSVIALLYLISECWASSVCCFALCVLNPEFGGKERVVIEGQIRGCSIKGSKFRPGDEKNLE
jgi:hypothetical protein